MRLLGWDIFFNLFIFWADGYIAWMYSKGADYHMLHWLPKQNGMIVELGVQQLTHVQDESSCSYQVRAWLNEGWASKV